MPNNTEHVARREWLPRDARANRNGLNPDAERVLPLRRIGDPANMESKVPAIKAAAEIKQQEDLKAQKLKAIRYLATIGCGCYNADGKVTEALIASMEDCTEEVRLAAVQAISQSAACGRCQHCSQRSCCSPEILNKLSEIAYEKDEKGCPIEPSLRVRQAAVEAMQVCCPCPQPGFIPYSVPLEPTPVPETTPPPVIEEEKAKGNFEGPGQKPAPMPNPPAVDGTPTLERPNLQKSAAGDFLAPPTATSPATTSTTETGLPYVDFSVPATDGALSETTLVSAVGIIGPTASIASPAVSAIPQPVAAPVVAMATPAPAPAPVAEVVATPVSPAPLKASVPPNLVPAHARQGISAEATRALDTDHHARRTATHTGGKISDLNYQQGTITITLPENVALEAGSRMLVYHQYNLGRISTTCDLIVVSGENGTAIARPTTPASFSKVALGDTVVLVR